MIVKDPQGAFQTVTLMSTDVELTARRIIEVFVDRWSIEVTFREARDYLGIETQRQWSDKGIARTTPVLFGLYSMIVMMGNRLFHEGKAKSRQAAWYKKSSLAFSDLLIAVLAVSLEEMNYTRVDIANGTDEIDEREVANRLLQLLLSAA